MSPDAALFAEYMTAVGITSWGALKKKKVPWPGSVVRSGVGFGMLGVVALGAPEFAVVLGAGMLLGLLVGTLNKGGAAGAWTKFAAVPPEVIDPSFPFHVITF